jgi:hypothetical protein
MRWVGFHLPTHRFLFFSAMPATLTEAQLLSAFLSEQAEAVLRERSAGIGIEADDSITAAIAFALATVDFYTTGWLVPADLLSGWAKDICVWRVTQRLGIEKESTTAAKDRAYLELEAVRDGKNPSIARDPTAAANTTGAVSFGGRPKVL